MKAYQDSEILLVADIHGMIGSKVFLVDNIEQLIRMGFKNFYAEGLPSSEGIYQDLLQEQIQQVGGSSSSSLTVNQREIINFMKYCNIGHAITTHYSLEEFNSISSLQFTQDQYNPMLLSNIFLSFMDAQCLLEAIILYENTSSSSTTTTVSEGLEDIDDILASIEGNSKSIEKEQELLKNKRVFTEFVRVIAQKLERQVNTYDDARMLYDEVSTLCEKVFELYKNLFSNSLPYEQILTKIFEAGGKFFTLEAQNSVGYDLTKRPGVEQRLTSVDQNAVALAMQDNGKKVIFVGALHVKGIRDGLVAHGKKVKTIYVQDVNHEVSKAQNETYGAIFTPNNLIQKIHIYDEVILHHAPIGYGNKFLRLPYLIGKEFIQPGVELGQGVMANVIGALNLKNEQIIQLENNIIIHTNQTLEGFLLSNQVDKQYRDIAMENTKFCKLPENNLIILGSNCLWKLNEEYKALSQNERQILSTQSQASVASFNYSTASDVRRSILQQQAAQSWTNSSLHKSNEHSL